MSTPYLCQKLECLDPKADIVRREVQEKWVIENKVSKAGKGQNQAVSSEPKWKRAEAKVQKAKAWHTRSTRKKAHDENAQTTTCRQRGAQTGLNTQDRWTYRWNLRVGQTKLKTLATLEVSTMNTNYEFKNITTEEKALNNKLEFIHQNTNSSTKQKLQYSLTR